MSLGFVAHKLFGTPTPAGITLAGWLATGSTTAHPINPSSYSTFADVEADEEVVRQLMTVHNAVDYLATSDGTDELIGQIINSDICAKWINLRDYALDMLSANPTIKDLMDVSDEHIEALVPVMTSNTTPEGECIASYEYSNLPIWKAFDSGETSGDGWLGYSQAVNQYIGYKFTCPQNVKNFRLYIEKSGSNTFSDAHAVFEASNDGATWETISTHSLGSITTAQFYTFYFNTDNESSYMYYRVRFPEVVHIGGVGGMTVITLQFYGVKKTLMPLVPTMTSNTTPKGEAIAKDVLNSSYDKFKVFDGVLTDGGTWHSNWNAQSAECDKWIGYDFKKPVCIKAFTAFNYTWESSGYYPQNQTSLTLAYSNDGTNWTMVGDAVTLPVGTEIKSIYDNEVSARYWAVFFSDYNRTWVAQSTKACTLTELQFYTYAPHSKYGYGEWALMPQVPKMTSNTAPYGTAFASGEYGGYPAWNVFDSNKSTYWVSTGMTNQHVGYHFTKPVRINSIKIASYGSTHNGIKNFKMQYSNDGTNYTDVYSDVVPDNTDPTAEFTYSFDNDISAEYWRLFIIDEYSPVNNIQIGQLQFYAWQPKGNVPIMTSNTAPYGEASTDSTRTNYEPWKAFNEDLTNGFLPQNNTAGYVGYTFTNPVSVKKAKVVVSRGGSTGTDTDCVIEYLDTDGTWKSCGTLTITNGTAGTFEIIDVNVNAPYALSYRLRSTNGYIAQGANQAYIIAQLQFYGRELSVSVPAMTSNTAPYGVASASSELSGYDAYRAFDGGINTAVSASNKGWCPVNNTSPYIQFEFPHEINLKFLLYRGLNYLASNDAVIKGSNDGVNFTDLHEVSKPASDSNALMSDAVSHIGAYKFIRVDGLKINTYGYKLQFFGLDYSEREFAEGSTMKYLYDHGVEFDSFVTWNTSSASSTSYTIEENELKTTLTQPNTNNCALGVGTEHNIDVTDYSILRMRPGKTNFTTNTITSGPFEYGAFGVNSSQTGTYGSAYVAEAGLGFPVVVDNGLDISSVNGNMYIYANFDRRGTGTRNTTASISELWLE